MTRPGLIVWLAWLVLMAGANLATPLYAVYAQSFGFSSLVLTLVFATYAVVLVPTLVLAGRLSDRFGRRPVIVGGLAISAAGLLVFALADDVAWLFAARALQGLAVGTISGAATAALVELDADGDRRRAALLAGLAQAGGSALGPVVAGVLAEWASAPFRTPYGAGLGATVVCAAAVLFVPEEGGDREPWRPQWPRVPAELRGRFLRVSLTAATAWAGVALYLSIVPSYAEKSLHMRNLAGIAAVAAVALGTSFALQIVSQRSGRALFRSQALGLGLLAAGLVLLVVAAPLASLPVLLVAALFAGAGHALAYLNAQEELNELAPGERRGEVTSAFIACIYALVAGAVIATGLLDLRFSLSASVGAVASVLAALALVAGVSRGSGRSARRASGLAGSFRRA